MLDPDLDERLDAILHDRRNSISFAAPELQDFHWGVLKEDLEDLLEEALHREPPDED
jgi:hypothetical protein